MEVGTSPSEIREQIPFSRGAYLGGLLEVGGSVGLSIGKSRGKPYAKPFIGYNDDQESRILKLIENFGGHKYKKKNENTWSWYIKDASVANIAREIQPFAPSRSERIQAILDWANTQDTAERLKIAARIKGKPRNLAIEKEQYTQLVSNPIFVAGMYDARGEYYQDSNPKGGTENYPRIMLFSVNKAVLDALAERFGGKARVNNKQGTYMRGSVRKDSYVWQLDSADNVRQFAQFISPHVMLKRVA